jgi:hypothetical protein
MSIEDNGTSKVKDGGPSLAISWTPFEAED